MHHPTRDALETDPRSEGFANASGVVDFFLELPEPLTTELLDGIVRRRVVQ